MASGTYRYDDAVFCVLDPSESVATAYTRLGPGGSGGVVKVNESGVRLLTVIGDPAKVTVVPVAKSEPATVTTCPPPPDPDDGVSEEIDGPAKVYRAMNVFQHVLIRKRVSGP